MLTLVHPAPAGQDPPRRKGARSPTLSLTASEAAVFRAALANVARAFGGYGVLATAVGVPVGTLYHAANPKLRPAPGLVIRIAKAAGMRVEALLTPTLSEVGRCNACGSRIAGGAA